MTYLCAVYTGQGSHTSPSGVMLPFPIRKLNARRRQLKYMQRPAIVLILNSMSPICYLGRPPLCLSLPSSSSPTLVSAIRYTATSRLSRPSSRLALWCIPIYDEHDLKHSCCYTGPAYVVAGH
ncbi:hypothetical protein AB1N83_010921 [Pleurotus pulmonarius]